MSETSTKSQKWKRVEKETENNMWTQMIDEILDTVSHVDDDTDLINGKLKEVPHRWGDDTDCGTNEEIHDTVSEILNRYGYFKEADKQ